MPVLKSSILKLAVQEIQIFRSDPDVFFISPASHLFHLRFGRFGWLLLRCRPSLIQVFRVKTSTGAVVAVILTTGRRGQAHSGQQGRHATPLTVVVVIGAGLLPWRFGQPAVDVIVFGFLTSDKPVLNLDLSEMLDQQPKRVNGFQ